MSNKYISRNKKDVIADSRYSSILGRVFRALEKNGSVEPSAGEDFGRLGTQYNKYCANKFRRLKEEFSNAPRSAPRSAPHSHSHSAPAVSVTVTVTVAPTIVPYKVRKIEYSDTEDSDSDSDTNNDSYSDDIEDVANTITSIPAISVTITAPPTSATTPVVAAPAAPTRQWQHSTAFASGSPARSAATRTIVRRTHRRRAAN